MDSEDPPDDNIPKDRAVGLSPQVLEYYKRFGRHRDLEQYFSLNTVQGDLRDPASIFWRSVKEMPDSDSGPSDPASVEVCRISISCSVANPVSSQEATSSEQNEPDSPPIINEDVAEPPELVPHEKEEAHQSDFDTPRKSPDTLDTSMNKPQSPSSSIASRKLEWDSLADVGYANDNKKKHTKFLSTLERLALYQQLSKSDDNISGHPNAHSTPFEDGECIKNKKGLLKNITKVTQMDTDTVKFDVDSNNPAINLSLTKHISFNDDPISGEASVKKYKVLKSDGQQKSFETANSTIGTDGGIDKEIQANIPSTSKNRDKTPSKHECLAAIPVLLNLDVLKQSKSKRLKYYRAKLGTNKRKSKKIAQKERLKSIPSEVTIGSQVSETDSFEYMPAHVYQQNKNSEQTTNPPNKSSSLGSSGGYTTLSSKSEHSSTKDLEKAVQVLINIIQHKYENEELKKKLVKNIIEKVIKKNCEDNDSTSDFLTRQNVNRNYSKSDESSCLTTTSTSEIEKYTRKKSILHTPKKTMCTVKATVNNEVIYHDNPTHTTSNTESVRNIIEESTSEGELPKTTSEQIYQYYLKVQKKERIYKEKLKIKHMIMKDKLTENLELITKSASFNDVKDKATSKRQDVESRQVDPGTSKKIDTTEKKSTNDATDISKRENVNNSGKLNDRKPTETKIESNDSVKSRDYEKRSCVNKISYSNKSMQHPASLPRSSKWGLHYCCCPYHFSNNQFRTLYDSEYNTKVLCKPNQTPLHENEGSFFVGKCCLKNNRNSISAQCRGSDILNEGKCGNLEKVHSTNNSQTRKLQKQDPNNIVYIAKTKSYSVPQTSRTQQQFRRLSESNVFKKAHEALSTPHYVDKNRDSRETKSHEDPLSGQNRNSSDFSKNLVETEAILKDFLEKEIENVRQGSICSKETFEEHLFAYLDEEKSEDSPILGERNKGEKCGAQYKGVLEHQSKLAKTEANEMPHISPRSKEISTQVTPRHDLPGKDRDKNGKCYTNEWIRKNLRCDGGGKDTSSFSEGNNKYTNKGSAYKSETSETKTSSTLSKEALLGSIEDIIKRYGKKKLSPQKRPSRHKHYRDIINKLRYLLETEKNEIGSTLSTDATKDFEAVKIPEKSTDLERQHGINHSRSKGIHRQLKEDSSTLPSTDIQDSSEHKKNEVSSTCLVPEKTKRDCDKYHKCHCKCKVASKQKTEARHNCRRSTKHIEKRKNIAYNLVIQPMKDKSRDITVHKKGETKLKDVVVKVPVTIKDNCRSANGNPFTQEPIVSESDTLDSRLDLQAQNVIEHKFLTVREYLERNRPEFVNNVKDRQSALRMVNESRRKHQDLQRQLLSLKLRDGLNAEELERIERAAELLGEELRRKQPAPKFISERAMKEHSRRIYKSLPEVVEKKEKIKKNNLKKTNLIMTSLFNKNLQRRALKGSVDISNYSSIIKI